jgi:hypothetical protein
MKTKGQPTEIQWLTSALSRPRSSVDAARPQAAVTSLGERWVTTPRVVGSSPTGASRSNQYRLEVELQPGFRTAQPKPHGSVNLSIRLLAVDRKGIHNDVPQLPDRDGQGWTLRQESDSALQASSAESASLNRIRSHSVKMYACPPRRSQ